jgi:hypothetical protein
MGRDQLQYLGINWSIILIFIIWEQKILDFLMPRGLQADIKLGVTGCYVGIGDF